MSGLTQYYLGAPIWGQASWKGQFFSAQAQASEFLAEYAQFFNAVEGNTTFYNVPSADMVQRWLEATHDNFRFSFKFPRTITHDAKLQHCQEDVNDFLKRMQPLGQRLESFMIQLPASFSPQYLPVLKKFLEGLPKEFKYAVEVRHPDFFINQDYRAALNQLLQAYGVDRIIFESRPVHSAPALDQATKEAHERKPRLPVQLDQTARAPVLRYIGHPIEQENYQWLKPWVAQTARWIESGSVPRVFIHTPDNNVVPCLALWFHEQLKHRLSYLVDLSEFPCQKGQASLF